MRALVIIFDYELRIALSEPRFPFLLHLENCRTAPAFDLSEIVAALQPTKLNTETALQVSFARQEQCISPDFCIAANPLLLTRVTRSLVSRPASTSAQRAFSRLGTRASSRRDSFFVIMA